MKTFKDRMDLADVDLPLSHGLTALHPRQVILRFLPAGSLDFGALCYLRRSNARRKANKGRKVDLESFSQVRAEEVRRLIQRANDRYGDGDIRPTTMVWQYREFIYFLDWCDKNGHGNVLTNATHGRLAFRAYITELRRLVDQHQRNQNTAAQAQLGAMVIMEDFFEIDNLADGLNLLQQNNDLKEHTRVPDDGGKAQNLAWYSCLFNGFSNLVLNQTPDGRPLPFPFDLALPPTADKPHNKLWVFPISTWWPRPSSDRDRCYDFYSGRIREIDEIAHLYSTPQALTRSVFGAHRVLAEANGHPYHPERLWRGIIACQAFYMIFIAVTAANSTPAAETPWNEEFDAAVMNPSNERHRFRTIKYRANGREVSFEIGNTYMPELRRYLQLRKHLLMGKSYDRLFFTYHPNKPGEVIRPVNPGNLRNRIFALLRHLSPNIETVTPRQWRAAKGDHFLRNNDPAMAAQSLQNKLSTVLSSYSEGTEVTHQVEMGAYLAKMEQRMKAVLGNSDDVLEDRAAGGCISPAHPKAIMINPAVKPDCNSGEGCLFCDKYRVHSDDTDTRKLLSARYVIRVTSQYSASMEERDQVFGPIIAMIDYYLGLIRDHDANLVARVEHEVEAEGELDLYWQSKLDILTELGMELL